MSDIAIQVENLSKQYRIGGPQRRSKYKSLRESLTKAAQAPFRRAAKLLRGEAYGAAGLDETIWALKNISFEVKQGEVLGIIGRNGAGKSTLLKILSRITEPTEGEARVYGRVGSLLEVGMGFHPELTGRENIYLNGAILGMRRAEIERKFDGIVEFAEIEKFLDTPVKHYSSGMYVRLAFAVSAHLEPDILLLDEVLAVGDAAFQKKCLGKMGEVTKEGRAILFVSHNMGAIASLCNRCLLMDKGSVIQDGSPSNVISLYQSNLYSTVNDTSDLSVVERYGTGKAKFTSLRVIPLGPDGTPWPFLQNGQNLRIELKITAQARVVGANAALIVYDTSGYRLIDANTALQGTFLDLLPGQEACVEFELESVLLKPGVYLLGLWLGRANVEDIDGITYATSFSVEADPDTLMHSGTFPGVYQCRYTHNIVCKTVVGD